MYVCVIAGRFRKTYRPKVCSPRMLIELSARVSHIPGVCLASYLSWWTAEEGGIQTYPQDLKKAKLAGRFRRRRPLLIFQVLFLHDPVRGAPRRVCQNVRAYIPRTDGERVVSIYQYQAQYQVKCHAEIGLFFVVSEPVPGTVLHGIPVKRFEQAFEELTA